MGRIKGCANEACEAHKKRITYEAEMYCSKCGHELVYVCKDCYTQLPNSSGKCCVRCLAKHEDRKDKGKEKAAAELGLSFLAYNLKRAINMVGTKALIAAIRG